MNKSPMVRMSPWAHQTLKKLAAQRKVTLHAVIDQAIEAYSRQLFLEQVNAGYKQLKADPRAWKDYQKEFSDWDVTLLDGIA